MPSRPSVPTRMLALGLLLFGGCTRSYRPPAENEPHAILKIRHVVQAKLGPEYGALTLLGGRSIDERNLTPEQLEAGTWQIRVRPEAAAFEVRGHSFHREQRQVQRSRQVPEKYYCPQQQCSYRGGRNVCYTVSGTCTRNRTEYYWTTETVAVDDDACSRALMLAPVAGHAYMIQFDYLGGGACEAQCFEQVAAADGSAALMPCAAPAAPVPAPR